MGTSRTLAFALVGLVIGCGGGGGGDDGDDGGTVDATPSGNGIAVDCPGDVGIGNDPRVIFADDFESYTTPDDLTNRWDDAYQIAQLRIARETDNIYAGAQSIEMTAPQQTDE